VTDGFGLAAMMAAVGDRDDPKTLVAWLAAVNGRILTIDAHATRLVAEEGWVALARRFDGLDGYEVCAVLEKVFDELRLYEEALLR
jgi:hypothetical protein